MASRHAVPNNRGPQPATIQPAPEQVRAELDRLLSSPEFQSNERLSGFLAHVVAKTLDDRCEEVKEATIGLEVFGRKPGYDTRSDAIVRTEARRLREKLAQHYIAAGRSAAVRIEIPKGTYVPQFHLIPEALPVAGHKGSKQRRIGWALAGSLAVLATIALVAWMTVRGRPAHQVFQTIAILPFANADPTGQYQYLSEGIGEDLERDLSRAKQLRIRMDPPVEWLTPRDALDYRVLSQRLHVDAVLDGRLTRSAGHPEIRVSLIRGSDASILWTDRFESGFGSGFGPGMTSGVVEAQIEQAVAKSLGVALPRRAHSENAQAHDTFLEARNLWATRRGKDGEEALALFNRALKLDPGYALAYMGIADAYGLMALHGEVDPQIGISKGKQAALKAIELDPTLAEAHAALGLIYFVSWEWKDAEREYQRAIELNPSYDRPYVRTGVLRFYAGDFKSAEHMTIEAESLSPYSLSLPIIRAQLYYYWRRYEDSVKLARQVQQVDPRNTAAMAVLACDYSQQGKGREALEAVQKVKALEPGFQLDLVPCVAAIGGLGEEWRAKNAGPKAPKVNPYVLAVTYTSTHDRERVLAWLEKAVAERTPDLPEARFEPDFDFVRGDPRFQAVIAEELSGGNEPGSGGSKGFQKPGG